LGELAADAAADVSAAGKQRDARGFVQSFEPTNNGEKLETATSRAGFAIRGGKAFAIADGLVGELPAKRAMTRSKCFGVQQIVRGSGVHAAGSFRVRRGRSLGS